MIKLSKISNKIPFGQKQSKKNSKDDISFKSNNFAPLPVYTAIPYGINKIDYIKLGVDKTPDGKEIHFYRLANGQNVEIVQTDTLPTICTKVGVGSFDEQNFPKGISHFIEHSLFHSSKNYSDIQKELDKITINNNAYTDFEQTVYHMDLADDTPETMQKALDLHSDMLFNPRFDKIDKEKPIVCAEFDGRTKDEIKNFSIYKNMFLFPGLDFAGANIIGNRESINSITIDDMFKYHQKYYQPHNLNTVVATKGNPDEVIKSISNAFLPKSPNTFSPIQKRKFTQNIGLKRFDTISKTETKGSIHFFINCGENLNFAEKTKLQLLIQLIKNRNDHFLGYLESIYGNDVITLYNIQSSDNMNANEELQILSNIIKDITLNPVSDSELETAKKDLLDQAKETYTDDNLGKIEQILENYDFNKNSYFSFIDRENLINSLKKEDITSVIQYLNLNNCTMGVTHPKDTTQEDIIKNEKKTCNNIQPFIVSTNLQPQTYSFTKNIEPISGKNIYSTVLNNGTKLLLIDSNEDEYELKWKLSTDGDYFSNPASPYVFKELRNKYFSLKLSQVDSLIIEDIYSQEDISKADKLANRLNAVNFTEDDFQKAKKEALSEIENRTKADELDFFHFCCGEQYNKKREFLKEKINSLTLNELINDYNNMLLNSCSTVIAKGPFSKNPEAMQQIANSCETSNIIFKQANPNKKLQKSTQNQTDCGLRKDENNQNTINQTYIFNINKNYKDEMIFELISGILADKNFAKIREKDGLAYHSGCGYIQNNNIGIISLETNSSCNSKDDVRNIYNSYSNNIQEILNGKITQEELRKAKNKLKKSILSDMQNRDGIIIYLEKLAKMPGGIESLNYTTSLIDSITIDDIVKTSNYIFSNKPKYYIEGSEKIINENRKLFDGLVVEDR